ncbi:MAG: hypothetical protein IJ796_04915 [Lachnospiraceae bacterium]|nr:hypothetical protein [Lachnospiraceae bacterium]
MGLYEELRKYGEGDTYPYHMPGHKRKAFDFLPEGFVGIDITEIDGFDNLHHAEGIIKEAQDFAASVCGSDKAYFLVGGSSAGVLAAISAAVPYGGKLLIVRNAHGSAYNAMGLRGIEPVYLFPEINPKLGFCEAVKPEKIREVLSLNREARAVFIVSPTYEGRVAKVREIADIVHGYGLPLIVDEAHGAHLPFARGLEGYGESAVNAGADLVIQSTHKTLPAPTQTAILHLNGSRIDKRTLEKYLRAYQSSSPSYPLMAGIDGAVRYMAGEGVERLREMRDRFRELTERVNRECRTISVIPAGYTGSYKGSAADFAGAERENDRGDGCFNGRDLLHDIGKLVIFPCDRYYLADGENSGKRATRGSAENHENKLNNGERISGKMIADMLRRDFSIETEMSCERYCLAMFTVSDGADAYERMYNALKRIDDKLVGNRGRGEGVSENIVSHEGHSQGEIKPCKDEVSIENYEADFNTEPEIAIPYPMTWEMKTEKCPLDSSAGRIAGEMIGIYPPGTPLLVPGERITDEHVTLLRRYISEGLNVIGIYRELAAGQTVIQIEVIS